MFGSLAIDAWEFLRDESPLQLVGGFLGSSLLPFAGGTWEVRPIHALMRIRCKFDPAFLARLRFS